MSGFFICPQQEKGETKDDYLIRLSYDALKGEKERRDIAKLTITLLALTEMEEYVDLSGEDRKNFDEWEDGVKLSIATYKNPISVRKDLEMNLYGQSPSFKDSYSIIDSFASFGKLKNSRAGFMLDFFSNMPTRTQAFAQGASLEEIRKACGNIFSYTNAMRNPAYSEKTFGKKVVDLSRYEKGNNIESLVVEGEVSFGKPTPQNEVISGMMDNFAKVDDIFVPKKFVIKTYDFKIDFELKPDKKSERGMSQIGQRVRQVFGEKAKLAA